MQDVFVVLCKLDELRGQAARASVGVSDAEGATRTHVAVVCDAAEQVSVKVVAVNKASGQP